MTLNLYLYYKYYLIKYFWNFFYNKLIIFFKNEFKQLKFLTYQNFLIFYLFPILQHIDINFLYVISLSDFFSFQYKKNWI